MLYTKEEALEILNKYPDGSNVCMQLLDAEDIREYLAVVGIGDEVDAEKILREFANCNVSTEYQPPDSDIPGWHDEYEMVIAIAGSMLDEEQQKISREEINAVDSAQAIDDLYLGMKD